MQGEASSLFIVHSLAHLVLTIVVATFSNSAFSGAFNQHQSAQIFKTFLLLNIVKINHNIVKIVHANTNQRDVDALIALHDGWLKNPTSWDTSKDPCDDGWLGIWCNDDQTRVIGMLLIDQNLEGRISPFIGNMTRLVHLDLSSNQLLGGTLPLEMGKLERLERLFIQNCNLSGTIPLEIGNMTRLQYFGLTDNNLVGSLPPTIGLLEDIIWLDVGVNRINGTLPVSNNVNIGVGLDNLTKARHFHLERNEFSGLIPPSLFNTQLRLVHILLYDNALFGGIPSTISNLLHVEIIRFDQNSLNGTLPSTISSIKNLTTLQVDHNAITGRVPDLLNNTKLQILTIGNNPLDPFEIPTWITQLTNLRFLSMDSANLIGNIPIDLFRSKPFLTNVSLASNQLNGTLNLTAANVPLITLNLTSNQLTNVDKGIYTDAIILDANPYCEIVPDECTMMQNQTLVPTPSPPTSTTSSCTAFCFPNYAINPKLNICQCVRPVIAYCEFYAVKVPVISSADIEFAENQYVTKFNENNVVQGLTFDITQLRVEVVTNYLIAISVFPPISITLWPSTHASNLSYAIKNQDIQFPSIGPMSCEYTSGPYPEALTVETLSKGAKIGIGVGVAIFGIFLLFVGFYVIKVRKRALKAEKLNKPFAAWIGSTKDDFADIPQTKGARWFSLSELRICTNNFNVTNEIGEGGYGKVYKGILSSGEEVAIKRARSDSLQGAPEFKKEIEVLSRVHHRNLVGLVGFCFENGEQMLVYEFMPNGTLRDYLSGQSGLQMDWYTRIRFALDSARGIAYLHNEANPPIIHRDIKSTNILLDKKSVAKVADFGLCKLASNEDGVVDESTDIRGTMGYLDPEYFLNNKLTDKSDVYSFGVVLIELITGRAPFQGGRYIVNEVKTTLEKGGISLLMQTLVDHSLIDYDPKCLERLVHIALICVEENPNNRFTMVEIVKELETLIQVSHENQLASPPIHEKMDKVVKPSQLYNKELHHSTQNYDSSSFGYSGSYLDKPVHIVPK